MLKASQLGLGIIARFPVISKPVFNVFLIFLSSMGLSCTIAGSAPGTMQNMNRNNRFTEGISSPGLGWFDLFIYNFGRGDGFLFLCRQCKITLNEPILICLSFLICISLAHAGLLLHFPFVTLVNIHTVIPALSFAGFLTSASPSDSDFCN